MTSLPYVPTSIFSWKNTVYILRSTAPNSGTFELAALNTTDDFDTTSLPLDTLSTTLPFPNDGRNAVITPVVDSAGDLLVYTGDCSRGIDGSALWQFTPGPKALNGNGTWREIQLSPSTDQKERKLNGANYLAAAAAFSPSTNDTASLYVFGGMCPHSTTSKSDSWTVDADYSNAMLELGPMQSASDDSVSFEATSLLSRGSPIAEAGFSMTPLMPTFPNASDGSQSQNQNFVLIGGHTQQAFINMSQVALFSLPEQSWTFIPVDSPDSTRTDLALRDTSSVDPRSGHTAVLTPDGRKIVVIGGWVGEVGNPASPQVAILELGSGYGGSGDWQWTTPDVGGAGIASGSGLYGHGAAMLAGDVMLITGGYQIQSVGSKSRRSGISANANNYLLNVTSNSWVTSYTHPRASNDRDAQGENGHNEDGTAKRAGLGVGLTFGILAIIAAVLFVLWYRRRLRTRREARDEELRNLAAGAHRFHLSTQPHSDSQAHPEMALTDSGDRDQSVNGEAYPWNAPRAASQGRLQSAGSEAERTGLLYEIPSPTRGLRRSLHSRSTYQPAPRFDDGRRVPSLNAIHPIDERGEYDEDVSVGNGGEHQDTLQRREYNLLSNVPVLDPFQDPPDTSRTPSPQSPQEREAEVRRWVDDWTAAESILHHGGRLSPEKTDRTSSTLSEQSARSLMSHSSMQQSVGSVTRTVSQRSAALVPSAPLRPPHEASKQESPNPAVGALPGTRHRRTRSLVLPQDTPKAGAPESSQGPSFPHLRFEGEALLGEYSGSGESSPTKLHQRARGWVGSVRRALTGSDRSHSTSPENNASTSSSPTKSHHLLGSVPRRAASTGGMYWQKRQGAKDWETDKSIDGKTGRPSGEDDEEGDWDVESAVERRVVQVMFTVPKERLRVVNQGPDEEEYSTASAVDEDVGVGSSSMTAGKGKERV